jgi:serine/threonine protein kinase
MLRLNKAAMVDFKMSDFLEMEPLALDLIKQLLEREPANRITAKDALRHKYFDKV